VLKLKKNSGAKRLNSDTDKCKPSGSGFGTLNPWTWVGPRARRMYKRKESLLCKVSD